MIEMSKNNNIKNILKERFDKNDNYNQILSKMERKNEMKKINWFKYSLVPICLMIIVGSIIFFAGDNTKTFIPDDVNNKNIININKAEEKIGGLLNVRLNVRAEDFKNFNDFAFISNIKVPADFNKFDKYIFYVQEACEESWEKCQKLPYNILRDYVLWYEKEAYESVHKRIRVSFSELGEPLRDYWIDSDNLNVSRINDTELIISSWSDMFIVEFKFNNLNFDIETSGITETELIQLLESILK